MFARIFTRRRARRFHWAPAVNTANPHLATALSTMPVT